MGLKYMPCLNPDCSARVLLKYAGNETHCYVFKGKCEKCSSEYEIKQTSKEVLEDKSKRWKGEQSFCDGCLKETEWLYYCEQCDGVYCEECYGDILDDEVCLRCQSIRF